MSGRGLVYGHGVNDFQGRVTVNGKHITEYYLWKSMIARCYSPLFHLKNPTYKGCQVEPQLLSFTNFIEFVRGLKGFGEFDEVGRPFALDKDLLIKGNKIYSTDTICFVPLEVNSFLANNKAIRGNLPVGVVYHKRDHVYQAAIRISSKVVYLGSFSTPEEAFGAYKIAKEAQAKVLANKWVGFIDERAYNALINYEVDING